MMMMMMMMMMMINIEKWLIQCCPMALFKILFTLLHEFVFSSIEFNAHFDTFGCIVFTLGCFPHRFTQVTLPIKLNL